MIRADGNMMCDAIIANCHQIRYKYEQITTVPLAASHSQCQSVILEFHKSRIQLKCDLLPLAELCGGRGELRALYQL